MVYENITHVLQYDMLRNKGRGRANTNVLSSYSTVPSSCDGVTRPKSLNKYLCLKCLGTLSYLTIPMTSYKAFPDLIKLFMLCYVMLYYVMLCYVMYCYVMLCYVMSCYVMSCYVMLYYVILCHVVLCYVVLSYVILCYVMLCHVVLWYVM